MSGRIAVSKLHRMYPTDAQSGYWYYTPDGHCVGPFDTLEEMECDIALYYKEIPERMDMSAGDLE